MHGESGTDCEFCDLATFRRAELFIQSDLSFFASGALGDDRVLPGAGIICPLVHRESPFELTPEEWADTRVLLLQAKSALDERLRPDGYNVVWNMNPDAGQEVAHVHLHLVPRFHDEPYAGRGARWLLKQLDNLRPDPSAPGLGRAAHNSSKSIGHPGSYSTTTAGGGFISPKRGSPQPGSSSGTCGPAATAR